jgi:hypothetical protein
MTKKSTTPRVLADTPILRLSDALIQGARSYIDAALDGFNARIKAVEAREAPAGKQGEPGTDGVAGRDGVDGKDGIGLADIIREADGNVIAVMSDGRTKSIGNISVRDGANGVDGVNGKDGADGLNGRDGLDGKDGKDGRDVDMDVVRSMVAELVAEAVAGIRAPADGRDGKDGVDGINGKDGVDGLNGKDGADGIGLAAAVQNADGQLIITDTKGGVHNIGVVRGVNGSDGRDGANGADGADGINGKDGLNGRDGFGFDDMDMVETDEGFVLRFSREGVTKDFRVPVPLDRGTFRDGQSYRKGDGVSFGGSFWIAQEDTTDKPETGKGWRLAVKRGRDGREGLPGKDGADGKPGAPGRDLTQLGMDGSKW